MKVNRQLADLRTGKKVGTVYERIAKDFLMKIKSFINKLLCLLRYMNWL